MGLPAGAEGSGARGGAGNSANVDMLSLSAGLGIASENKKSAMKSHALMIVKQPSSQVGLSNALARSEIIALLLGPRGAARLGIVFDLLRSTFPLA